MGCRASCSADVCDVKLHQNLSRADFLNTLDNCIVQGLVNAKVLFGVQFYEAIAVLLCHRNLSATVTQLNLKTTPEVNREGRCLIPISDC